MNGLSIVTPCSRPENLITIWPTIPQGSQWLVVLDRPNLDDAPPALQAEPNIEFACTTGVGGWGNAQRNLGLSRATRDYLYFLDDDNIVHPALTSVLAEHQQSRKIIVVNQLLADGSLRFKARPPVQVNEIDTAQVLVPRELATRFTWKPHTPRADGFYFAALYETCRKSFVFLDVDAAYYNYLAPTRTGQALLPGARRLGSRPK